MDFLSPKIYGTATMNDKGQIVIPAEAREELGLLPGTRLAILGSPRGKAVIIVKSEVIEERVRSLMSLFGGDDPHEEKDVP